MVPTPDSKEEEKVLLFRSVNSVHVKNSASLGKGKAENKEEEFQTKGESDKKKQIPNTQQDVYFYCFSFSLV